jgi:hypothetical protein
MKSSNVSYLSNTKVDVLIGIYQIVNIRDTLINCFRVFDRLPPFLAKMRSSKIQNELILLYYTEYSHVKYFDYVLLFFHNFYSFKINLFFLLSICKSNAPLTSVIMNLKKIWKTTSRRYIYHRVPDKNSSTYCQRIQRSKAR